MEFLFLQAQINIEQMLMSTYVLQHLTKRKPRAIVLNKSLTDLDTRPLALEQTVDAVNTSASQLVFSSGTALRSDQRV